MAFNGRMTQQYRSQNSHNNNNRCKQQQPDNDAFMWLVCVSFANLSAYKQELTPPQPDGEIAGCITDIGVPFQPEDLQKPSPQQIQKVFEWFAELLMNTTRETVEPAMRAAAEDVGGEYGEVVPADTRNLMGFYFSLRKLLMEVRSVHMLSISDIHKACANMSCGKIVQYPRLLLPGPSETYP